MINQQKPTGGVPETELNIGSGFKLIVGSTFNLIVGAFGLGGITNADKTSIGETWGAIQTTWATETRTWEAVSQLIANATVNGAGALWSIKRKPWQESTPWLTDNGITNFPKV